MHRRNRPARVGGDPACRPPSGAQSLDPPDAGGRSSRRRPPGWRQPPVRFDPDCSLCPELARNRRRVVPGYGARRARAVLIGEAPGRRGGDQTGVPFTRDRSGRRLQQLLIRVGLSGETRATVERPRLRCFITNLVRCNPPMNRAPGRREIERCRLHLIAELEVVRPGLVIALGLHAARFALARWLDRELPRIGPLHARLLEVPAGRRGWPRLVIPSRHPARVSNADWLSLERAVRAGLGRLGREGPPRPPQSRPPSSRR